MKKVNFNPLNSERIDNLRKEYLNQILAHPVCKKFIDKYEITEDEINRNTSKFIKVIEDTLNSESGDLADVLHDASVAVPVGM